MTEFRSFPPAEDFISLVNTIDWKSVYNNIITAAAIVAAVVVVISTRIAAAVIKYWKLNGDDIKSRTIRAIDYTYMFAAIVYNQGKNVGERFYSFRDLITYTVVTV